MSNSIDIVMNIVDEKDAEAHLPTQTPHIF